jgi:hypothetical protein
VILWGAKRQHTLLTEEAQESELVNLMVGKFKNLTGWYECKVVGAGEGGKWVVEWEDGDVDDTLEDTRQRYTSSDLTRSKFVLL